jgi:molybdopterin molybdotransferase
MPEREVTFYRVQTRAQALAHLTRFPHLEAEEVGLAGALGRVLAEPVVAPEDLPAFARATVDGYAVRARETFGASEATPALFDLAGEVAMGQVPEVAALPGQAVRVWTGGMLPDGADAVVMLEYARKLDAASLELTKAVAPGANVIAAGEDAAQGQTVLPAGRRLRPQEVGLLAALGLTAVPVVRRPVAAILSTGNEVVPAEAAPGPGQIRDVNGPALAALVSQAGGRALSLGLVPDDPERLRAAVAQGLDQADLVLVSGGSSVGAADWTLRTFLSFPQAELLVHGVAISPGKPLILVRVEAHGRTKSLWGLPGHVASALVSFHLFVQPLLRRRLQGAVEPLGRTVRARLARNLASTQGREDWVRIGLAEQDGRLVAHPILGPSGLVSTLVKADGLLKIDLEVEGLEAGEEVEVHLF